MLGKVFLLAARLFSFIALKTAAPLAYGATRRSLNTGTELLFATAAAMPIYELLCLAKPGLAKPVLASMMQAVGGVVYKSGGFVTQLKSYGDQQLAYDIRRPFEKYEAAHIWQMDLLVGTDALPALDHELRVNGCVLRWVVVRRPNLARPGDRLPALQLELQRAGNDGGTAAAAAQPPAAGLR